MHSVNADHVSNNCAGFNSSCGGGGKNTKQCLARLSAGKEYISESVNIAAGENL